MEDPGSETWSKILPHKKETCLPSGSVRRILSIWQIVTAVAGALFELSRTKNGPISKWLLYGAFDTPFKKKALIDMNYNTDHHSGCIFLILL